MSLPPFQALLDEHGAAVKRFLVAAAGPADADDCFQETWIAALRAYPDLRHGRELRAWLMRIAKNKAIDSHRARARRPLPVAEAPERCSPPPGIPVDGQPVWARVRQLPEKQRMAVFLRSAAELPYEDVARALECSQEAARRNVHEGLRRLREEMA